MTTQLYTFRLNLDFKILGILSVIDRFGGEWLSIEKREGLQVLKQLKSIATVQSVGASTRIEGSKMTNDEVKVLITNLKIEKLVERDQQEVLGYFYVIDIISESWQDIEISENSIKNLHKLLMKYSDKDQWHKGNYKKNSNSVEATNPDGSKTIIFNTTPPGIETEEAMKKLITWYNNDNETPPIIKSASFIYEFLSIHPFQDGNGRLSRLLSTLLLLKNNYPWIQYISFEHEIENRKSEYYHTLMDCQQQRPGEDITQWLVFFLNCLSNLQHNLHQKLELKKKNHKDLPHKMKIIYSFIETHPGCKSGEISEKLNIPLPTVKKILSDMIQHRYLAKHGVGAGTNYTTEPLTNIRENVVYPFKQIDEKKEIILSNNYSFFTIKKILLTPKFNWSNPDEWSNILIEQDLQFEVICVSNKMEIYKHPPLVIDDYNNATYYNPKFTLERPIELSPLIFGREMRYDDFPIKLSIQLKCKEKELKFEVKIVCDETLN